MMMDIISQLAMRDGWDCAYCTQPLIFDTDDYYRPGKWIYGEKFRICSFQFWTGAIRPTVDHYLPRNLIKQDPTLKAEINSIDNLRLCCPLCNSRKGARLPAQFEYEFYEWRMDHFYPFLELTERWRETRQALAEMDEIGILYA
jgi:hypothetical protein